MSNSANLKIRQRVLAEGKRRNFIANLKSKPPKRGSSGKETEVKGDLGNVLNYKNTTLLRRHISTQGRILPRRVTGLTAKQQRQLAKSVKRARQMCLIAIVRRRGGQK
jgi:small subunit ribosomal protein S18